MAENNNNNNHKMILVENTEDSLSSKEMITTLSVQHSKNEYKIWYYIYGIIFILITTTCLTVLILILNVDERLRICPEIEMYVENTPFKNITHIL